MKKVYSNYKVFHFKSKLKDISSGIFTAPLHIRIKPTNKCNHRCKYCCYRNKELYVNQFFNENDEIDINKMKQISKDLKQMGVKAVTFSGGGEPLCYPHIYKTIKQFSRQGIKIAMLTNGSLLKNKNAEILSQVATWIRISMDAADSKTYSKIRGVDANEFDKVCENIYNFSKIKKNNCKLGINFIVTEDNHKDIYKFLKLMRGLQVDHVKISESIMSTELENNKKYHFLFLKKVKKQILQAKSELENKNFLIIDKFDNFNEDNDNYKKKYKQCIVIQFLAVIGADMRVYTCQDKAYTAKGLLGSIKHKSFKQLWFSDATKARIKALNPNKECDHHCTQHNKNLILLDYFGLDKDHLEFI